MNLDDQIAALKDFHPDDVVIEIKPPDYLVRLVKERSPAKEYKMLVEGKNIPIEVAHKYA